MAERGLVHPSSHFPVAPPYVITTQHRQGLTWVHARVRVVLCTTVDSRDAPKHLALLPTIQTEIWSINTEVPLPSSASPHRWQILISGHLHGLQSLACFLYSFAFSRMYFKWNEAASDLLKCGLVLFFKLSKMPRDPTSCCVYRQPVFFTPEQWRLVWMSHGLFNHSRIWRHFGCFHILGITNEDAVDIHAQMCGHSSHFSGMNAQDWALWVYSKYVFTKYSFFFLKKLPNSFPAWLYHCNFPPVRYRGLASPHSPEPSVLMPVLLF